MTKKKTKQKNTDNRKNNPVKSPYYNGHDCIAGQVKPIEQP